jgi:hypothetical protein
LLEASVRIVRVVEERFDRQPGAAAETIGLELTLQVDGLSYRRDELETTLLRLVPGLLTPDQELIPGTLRVEVTEPERTAFDGQAVLGAFTVAAETAEQIPFEEIRRISRGAPAGALPARLRREFDLDRAPDIRTAPAWLPWLPLLGLQIEVHWPWAGS